LQLADKQLLQPEEVLSYWKDMLLNSPAKKLPEQLQTCIQRCAQRKAQDLRVLLLSFRGFVPLFATLMESQKLQRAAVVPVPHSSLLFEGQALMQLMRKAALTKEEKQEVNNLYETHRSLIRMLQQCPRQHLEVKLATFLPSMPPPAAVRALIYE
jgi:hypothetical protein